MSRFIHNPERCFLRSNLFNRGIINDSAKSHRTRETKNHKCCGNKFPDMLERFKMFTLRLQLNVTDPAPPSTPFQACGRTLSPFIIASLLLVAFMCLQALTAWRYVVSLGTHIAERWEDLVCQCQGTMTAVSQ